MYKAINFEVNLLKQKSNPLIVPGNVQAVIFLLSVKQIKELGRFQNVAFALVKHV